MRCRPTAAVFWADLRLPAMDVELIVRAWLRCLPAQYLNGTHRRWPRTDGFDLHPHRTRLLHVSTGTRRKVLMVAALALGAPPRSSTNLVVIDQA